MTWCVAATCPLSGRPAAALWTAARGGLAVWDVADAVHSEPLSLSDSLSTRAARDHGQLKAAVFILGLSCSLPAASGLAGKASGF